MKKQDLPSLKLLDCTLRDGGYYNNWDFSLEEAQDYIDNLARGGVDIIEIGFRFTPKAEFLGPFAYTRESLLKKLHLPEGVQFAVMINASDYLSATWEQDLKAAFVREKDSAISLVRIAAHIGQVAECDKLVEWLKAAGYDVGLNVMQISQADNTRITALVEDIEARFKPFEALYFADSLGNLTPTDVTRIVKLFRAASSKPIGFHGHDNIGLGVANSLAAIEAGATWVDATVTGMGRGAGNTQTEYLSLELTHKGLRAFNLLDIQRAATGWLSQMKKTCQWGTNIFYYEAGLRALHPSYVQQMLSSNRYEALDILVMIAALSGGEMPTSYRAANIDRALAALMAAPEGRDTVADRWKGRPVILVAGGPQGGRHWDAIVTYAKARKAIILALNHIKGRSPTDFDGVVCIHPARMMALLSDRAWSDLPLYTARDTLPKSVCAKLEAHASITDYGVCVSDNHGFEARSTGCTIPTPEALSYAWALAEAAGACELMFAGFDGYDGQSNAFRQTDALIDTLRKQSKLPVASLTASHYSVPHIALYSE
ncbi:MAG: aldolase catalytic domain-containing protein [Roseobacter sp.]|nr:aldolase catalytic domain-containing protein [Roseobacter sp.]